MQEYNWHEDLPWVIFSVDTLKFGIASTVVEGMETARSFTKIPGDDSSIRGLFKFREGNIPLVDLRERLNIKSRLTETNEFCQMLDAREQDHRNWLIELERSVLEHRNFTLATDPTKCAFGRWYESYEPNTHTLKSLLQKFDKPHRQIHSIAERVRGMADSGQMEAARKIIDDCRDHELSEMIHLFAEVKKEYVENNREIVIVFKNENSFHSFTVDSVLTVGTLKPFSSSINQIGHLSINQHSLIVSLAKQDKIDDIIILIDPDKLIG